MRANVSITDHAAVSRIIDRLKLAFSLRRPLFRARQSFVRPFSRISQELTWPADRKYISDVVKRGVSAAGEGIRGAPRTSKFLSFGSPNPAGSSALFLFGIRGDRAAGDQSFLFSPAQRLDGAFP
jgi:hypothetical protein